MDGSNTDLEICLKYYLFVIYIIVLSTIPLMDFWRQCLEEYVSPENGKDRSRQQFPTCGMFREGEFQC